MATPRLLPAPPSHPHRPRGTARRAAALAAAPLAAALVLGAAAPAAADAPSGVDDLRRDLDALLADPALEGASSGVVVRSLDNGDELYGSGAGLALTPASNAKLLTSAAALEVLGPDHRFGTEVSADSAPSGGRVEGDLYITGGGDPTLTAEAFDELAADVAAAGVSSVGGDLVADATLFDDERYHPDWDPEDAPYYYAAEVSALTAAANDDYDTGTVTVRAEPGAARGDGVEVALEPMGANLEVVNEAATGPAGGTPDLTVVRAPGTNEFTVRGTLPAGGGAAEELRTVHDPAAHAAHVFAAALEEHGVRIEGSVESGEAPDGAAELVRRDSARLADLLVPFMKLSNNGHAEMLVKAMGAEEAGSGTWKAGLAEVDAAVERIGVDTSRAVQTDGSGLAHSNKLTADTITDLLQAVRDEPWAAEWTASLPVAGDPDRMVGGTLSNRMRDTPAAGNVQAKTGTLTGASALSGYVTGADGERLAFAVVNNDYPGGAPRGVQDRIAIRLAEFSRHAVVGTGRAAQSPAPSEAPGASGTGLECSWAGTC
ncbi:D-alanyl-D-alanine carboxypeptidase/D-alanyl-D-alanine-endopeptidase [Nocardiopsis sp. CNT-189]|uniref:D-alanyl-D-alanine carboxypeptidase/D-alanyl-D-alanine endopeptidase n=1 Tax=Nocardiopsis oceanisediminis TaxID=2816862 RepID=UPI003B32A2FF